MSVLYPLIQALVLFAVAPLLSGITRVARARLHNRRGPGVLQEYRDIIKLLGRQSVGPDASGWVFRLTPYVMVGVMLTIATALPVVTVGSPLPQLGDLITLLYLFAIARFFFAISGLDTGSPLSDAWRAGRTDAAAWSVGCRTGCRFHQHQQHHRHRLSLAAEPEHPAGTGALCLCVRHLYRNGQTAVRPGGSRAGAAGRPAL